MIIIDAMVPIGRITLDRQRRLNQRFVPVDPRTFAVGPIGRCGAEIATKLLMILRLGDQVMVKVKLRRSFTELALRYSWRYVAVVIEENLLGMLGSSRWQAERCAICSSKPRSR